MLNPEYEQRIRKAFAWVFVFCLSAFLPLLFSRTGIFKPPGETMGSWFQRSGAVMTAFAAFAQFQASSIATLIAGSGFGETYEAFRKYKHYQQIAAVLSLVLVVVGTVIWGYGDLL